MNAQWQGYRRPPAWDDVGFGVGVMATAGVLAWAANQIPSAIVYAQVGPTLFPWIVVIVLAALGAILVIQGLRGGWEHDSELGHLDFKGGAWMLTGLVLNVALIERIGFILASTILFVFVARAFESKKPIRDAAIGFAMALLAYSGFDQLLGYKIGDGFVETYVQQFFTQVVGRR